MSDSDSELNTDTSKTIHKITNEPLTRTATGTEQPRSKMSHLKRGFFDPVRTGASKKRKITGLGPVSTNVCDVSTRDELNTQEEVTEQSIFASHSTNKLPVSSAQSKLEAVPRKQTSRKAATPDEKKVLMNSFCIQTNYQPYFEYSHHEKQDKGTAIPVLKCKLCFGLYRGSSKGYYNFKNHLEVKHSVHVIKESCKLPDVKTWLQTSNNKISKQDPFQQKVDDATAIWVAVDGQPLSVTSGLGFKFFSNTLAPNVNVKGRWAVRERIEKKAKEIKKKTVVDLSNLSNQRIHGITDIWATKSQQSVLGIKIQYLTDDLHMVNKTLSFVEFEESHTGKNIREKVVSELNDYEIRPAQFGVIASDNASNMLKAFNMNCFFDEKWEQVETNPGYCASESDDELSDNEESESNDGQSGSEDEDINSDVEILDSDEDNNEPNANDPEVVQEAQVHEDIEDLFQYGWDHHGCLAHKLQLVINDAINSDTQVKSLIKQVNDVIVVFRRSPKYSAILKKKTKRSVLAIGATRWNSILTALQRINEDDIFPHISSTLKPYIAAQVKRKPKKGKKKKLLVLPSATDRKKIDELVSLLLPFKVVTDKFQSNGVTSSIVISSLMELQNKLIKHSCSYFDAFRHSLLKKLKSQNRFAPVVKDDKFVIAAMLDPRYKLRLFYPKVNEQYFVTPTVDEAKATFNKMYNHFESGFSKTAEELNDQNCPSTLRNTGFDFLDAVCPVAPQDVRVDKDSYFSEPIISSTVVVNGQEIKREVDILEYWRNNASKYPILYEMAKVFLAIPASTGDGERLFSIAGTIKRQQRNRLGLSIIQSLLLVKDYYTPILEKKFKKRN